jgi:tRNA(adenine34) deaminase
MRSNDEKFMRLALMEAQAALEEDELPVGSVVVLNDEVWGKGRRKKDGNTRLDHGEMCALREALDKKTIK